MQNKNCAAAAVMFVHRLHCRLSGICRERADGHSRSPWCQWFLYLLHHLYRGRSWSGERQRRCPRWKCRLGQLATTDDNNDKQQANNMVVKTQWVIRRNKMEQKRRRKKGMKEKNRKKRDREVSALLIGWGHHRKQGSNWGHGGSYYAIRKQDCTVSQTNLKTQKYNK